MYAFWLGLPDSMRCKLTPCWCAQASISRLNQAAVYPEWWLKNIASYVILVWGNF
jgi:hypothetical protein